MELQDEINFYYQGEISMLGRIEWSGIEIKKFHNMVGGKNKWELNGWSIKKHEGEEKCQK